MTDVRKLLKRLSSSSSKRRHGAYLELCDRAASDPQAVAPVVEQLVDCVFDPKETRYRLPVEVLANVARGAPNAIKPVLGSLFNRARAKNLELRRRGSYALIELSRAQPSIFLGSIDDLADILNARLKHVVHPNAGPKTFEVAVNLINTFGNIALAYPKAVYIATALLNKCLNYPIYHPDRPVPELDKVYIGAARTLGIIAMKFPSYVRESVPSLLKLHIDAHTYQRWHKTRDRPDGMYQTVLFALDAVSRTRPDFIIPALVQHLGHEKRAIRTYALNYLGRIGRNIEQLIPSLINCLNNEDETVCQYAAYAIEKASDRDPAYVVEQLAAALRSPIARLRQYALVALALVAKHHLDAVAPLVPDLVRATRDEEGSVRWCAVETLGKIGGQQPALVKGAVDRIAACLDDPLNHLRWCAVHALERIGEHRPGYVERAVPKLIVCLDDPYEHVRWRARGTLKKLDIDVEAYQEAVSTIKRVEVGAEMAKTDRRALQTAQLLERAKTALVAVDIAAAMRLALQAEETLQAVREAGVGGTGSRPRLAIEAVDETRPRLRVGRWSAVRVIMQNNGGAAATDVEVRLAAANAAHFSLKPLAPITSLPADAKRVVELVLMPARAGEHDIGLVAAFGDDSGVRQTAETRLGVRAVAETDAAPGTRPGPGSGSGSGPSPYAGRPMPGLEASPYSHSSHRAKRSVNDMLGSELRQFRPHEPRAIDGGKRRPLGSFESETIAGLRSSIQSASQNLETKYCRYCGNELPKDGIFCTNCGNVLRQ